MAINILVISKFHFFLTSFKDIFWLSLTQSKIHSLFPANEETITLTTIQPAATM